MTLSPGVRLGPYEILGLIGAGGMGEVYRARDTRLDRTVALKALSVELATEPNLRLRFEREARAISALEHPHICALYDVGEEDGRAYFVMEHLSGETLAERLKKGPLPLPQALRVAAQIAEALATAHKQGIVHRDLKPGNVMLTKSGAKLLDFGLARLVGHGEPPIVDDLTSAPTASTPLTGRGTILGTVPYMAPEQVEGRPADARTDIWALGAILHEMVSGKRAFEGRSSAGLIAAILEREPAPLSTLQPLTPPALDRLVQRCLAKAPDDRWDSAHDLAEALRWIAHVAAGEGPTPTGLLAGGRRRVIVLGALALALASAIAGALAGRWLLARGAAPPSLVRSLLDVRPADELSAGGIASPWLPTPGGSCTALTWTPDGRSLVFVGRAGDVRRLYVRALDGEMARALEGTEGAQVPAVSPDGRWVYFWAQGALRRVSFAGGPAVVVVEQVPKAPTAIACGAEGRLFYDGTDGVIWSARPEQAPSPLTRRLDTEVSHQLPHLLPGGKALVYTVRHREWSWGDDEVVAHVLATGERKPLLQDATDARYVNPHLLVLLRRSVLHAVAFDPRRLEVRGTPVPLLDGVAQALTSSNSSDITGAGQFAVSSTGTLAYVPGTVVPFAEAELVAVDRQGRLSPLAAPRRSYSVPLTVSPDGRQLAVTIQTLEDVTLWSFDRERGTLGKLPPSGESDFPRWSPDGRHVAFSWLSHGVYQLALQRTDGAAEPEALARVEAVPSSWSPDGRQLALAKDGDIWIATVAAGGATVEPLTRTADSEQWPEFSPDGRWLAYGSNAAGRNEVYVLRHPGPGPRQPVSLDGGESPAWSPTGRELFFVSPRGPEGKRWMMAVDVVLGPTLTLGKPRPLFEFPPTLGFACSPARCYAVAPDGERFFVRQRLPVPLAASVTSVHLVQGWTEEVRTRVPSGP